MNSGSITRSIIIDGRKVRFTLEESVWTDLTEIADHDHQALVKLIARVDSERRESNLSAALRTFVVDYINIQEKFRPTNEGDLGDGPSMWSSAFVGKS